MIDSILTLVKDIYEQISIARNNDQLMKSLKTRLSAMEETLGILKEVMHTDTTRFEKTLKQLGTYLDMFP